MGFPLARLVMVICLATGAALDAAIGPQLYARRWNVELDLRNLKTTTCMDVLRCQTPQINDKQWWVHLLAYNVIRLLMAQAAGNADVDRRNLSFKHTVPLSTQWVACGLSPSPSSSFGTTRPNEINGVGRFCAVYGTTFM